MVRITQVFDISTTNLTVTGFTATYNVTAHLKYNKNLSIISNLNEIKIKEDGSDNQVFDSSGWNSVSDAFATSINNTLFDASWNDGSSNGVNVDLTIGVTSTTHNDDWDNSIADAFDTCVGAAMLNTNSHTYSGAQDFVDGVHFINAFSSLNTALNDASTNSTLLGDKIKSDINDNLSLDPADASGVLRDIIGQYGTERIHDGSGVGDLIGSNLMVVLRIKGADSNGQISITNNGVVPADTLYEPAQTPAKIIQCETNPAPIISINPCVFLLEWDLV